MRLVDIDSISLPNGLFEKVDNVPKFYEWLNSLPTIDATQIKTLQAEVKRLEPNRGDLVELVRCKDCRYFYFGFCHNRDGYVKFGAVRDRDWFCADAKKEVQDDSISAFADGEWWKEVQDD